MKYIFVLTEGETELRFVDALLSPYFIPMQCYLNPIAIHTGYADTGAPYKGGVPPYPRFKQQVMKLLNNPTVNLVTTMIDLYKIPPSFPGVVDLVNDTNPYSRVRNIEKALEDDVGDARFVAYLSLHDYEALLFADIDITLESLKEAHGNIDSKPLLSKRRIPPEEINAQSPPSHLVRQACPKYRKPVDGVLIAQKITLPVMRQKCPHFHEWLTKLEALCRSC